MHRFVRFVSLAAAAAALGACDNALEVENKNNPDVDKVFELPATIEQTLGSGYQQCRNSLIGGAPTVTGNIFMQLATMSGESYSQLNNFFMGPVGGIPRGPIQNTRGANFGIFGEFSSLSRQARTLANALTALATLKANNGSLGTPAQDLRANAWGFFVVGCNLGWLAAIYDSAGIVRPGMPSDEIPPLSGYKDVMVAALQMFDSALAYANNPAAATGFPTLAPWLSGATLSPENFVRFVRSYKARFRAAVARTPAERAAVDWNAVIADAEAGLKSDIVVNVGAATGWNVGFQGSQMHVDAAWHQISPMYYGMADVSGGYDTYLATPLLQRTYFLIVTPDQRFPQGATRAVQQAASPEPANYQSRPYLKNRTTQDTPGDPWGTSFYSHHRYKYIRNNSITGPYPDFLAVELNLLAAEGYIRNNNFAAATAKIDLSRVARGGLPALSGVVTSSTQPVPGGSNCVPRVPAAPSFTSTTCGTIFEAMKWEKRMELAYNFMGAWYFDSRGWGDLIFNTAVHYPVPYQEMDARTLPFYNLGGGGTASAPRGTYGF
ncbi:MAG: hypothetical protein ACT4P6_03225 [Gemmatimonadaceae bacterium]